ncbi:MAG: thiamine pyrophosphate-dependent dehydrogenase E1 component subunit alpha [Chloroflexi bacterium]|nr:thiamine pyrophosphate-dependent dehydrogenase E1 component subunit alpha [Chloroflexota bacterium]
MAHHELTPRQKLDLYYWMRLTRTFDDRMLALWKQGRGLGGAFSQRGHEAISVGAAYAMHPDDIVAPMHRDLGCYLIRGITPSRIFANLLGRETGVTHGRDANLHGMGDLEHGIIGFISHLPQSLPVALGVAMSFRYRHEAGAAITFTGDGASSAGLFHEVLNMAAVFNAPLVVIVENNQYAYSTPLAQQTKVPDIATRAAGYGLPGVIVDGNDVEAVYSVVREALDRAHNGDGATFIEAKTMRMLGHAIHDGAEYVPRELLAEWEAKDPLRRYAAVIEQAGIADAVELDEIGERCQREIESAIDFAEASPWPDPTTVSEGVYAP